MPTMHERVIGGAYDAGDYENHILPFLWLKGEDRATITEFLEQIAASDIHEVCLESRPHPDFCGPTWWEDLAFIITECKRLGLAIWILDDSHFPTGFANGRVKEHPEHRKTVLTHRTFDVVGPARGMSIALPSSIDPEEAFVGAVAVHDGEARELAHRTSEDGTRIFFDVDEPGLTQIVAIFTARRSGHNDDYINMVDKASCDLLIEAVYEPHYAHFADEFGTTIKGFFTDEPGFMNEKGAKVGPLTDSLIGKPDMPLPWSDELARRLQTRWGASWLSKLALLWTDGTGAPQARHAYMDEASRLYSECFDQNIGTWCRARGVMHIGHVIEDRDCHVRLGVGAGHYFRALAGQDMAGVDIVINQVVPGIDAGTHSYRRGIWDMEFFAHALPKLGSSAAHLDPKKQGRCMAEVFGAFGWHEGLTEMTWIANAFLVRGVNYFVPHAFSMAPFPDPDCPPHFYAHGNDPQFRQFGRLMTYMNRMSTLLSDGTAHPTCAVLYHADAAWAGPAMRIERVAGALTHAQIDFDFVPADAFALDAEYEIEICPEGHGFAVNGQRYRCLVLPAATFTGAATVAAVERLVEAGVPVICVDEAPTRSYDDAAAGADALGTDAFAGAATVALDNLADELRERGLYGLRTAEAAPWLRAYHYTKADEDYWFLVNESPRAAVSTTVLLADGAPLTGVAYDVLNGGSAPFDGALELAPYAAVLVVTGETAVAADARNTASVLTTAGGAGRAVACEVEGPWQVSYAAALDYPAFGEPVALAELENLSERIFPGVAGTFRYEASFTLDEDVDGALLDLGDVHELAEVALDGHACGVRIAPPYCLPLPRLAAGAHTLTIDVTNTLDHALTDMFSLSEPSEASGLLGPVRIVR